MKNKQNKKKREVRYKFEISEKIQNNAKRLIFTSKDNNEFNIYFENKKGKIIDLSPTNIDILYNRDTGKEKVILRQPIIKNEKLLSGQQKKVFEYEVIVVIDTSWKILKEITYASTCWLICSEIKVIDDIANFEMLTYTCEWIANYENKPENIMYANIIDKINQHNIKFKRNPKVAVIIDSDLDNIEGFNKQQIPIYSNFYLPNNFKIFYASSDSGTTEHPENKLMQICDKEAKNSLKEFISNID